MSLNINYTTVESELAKIKSTLGSSDVVADYNRLLAEFSESRGKEAMAIKDMITAEITLAWQLNSTLNKFANGIQSAVNEFKKLDQDMKKVMTEGGSGSSLFGGQKGYSGGGTGGGIR